LLVKDITNSRRTSINLFFFENKNGAPELPTMKNFFFNFLKQEKIIISNKKKNIKIRFCKKDTKEKK